MKQIVLSNAPGQSILIGVLTQDQRSQVYSIGHRRSFAKGETIFLRGEPGNSILVIEDGRVEISITSLQGRKNVLNHMGPGEVLGEIAVLDGLPRSADAIAASKVVGITIPRQAIMSFLTRDTRVSFAVIKELCAKVRNASEMFEVHAQATAGPRLARCLLRIADKWGTVRSDGSVLIAEKFSQSDLGEFSGLARENVNRQIRMWEEEAVIGTEDRRLVLLDKAELEVLAEL